jgi:peptidoglycan hydrolase-like protein with peptidoglycan-binding domain
MKKALPILCFIVILVQPVLVEGSTKKELLDLQNKQAQQARAVTTSTATTGSENVLCPVIERDLLFGSSGDDVKGLQQFLLQNKFYRGRIDGLYRASTRNAIHKLQTTYGITTKKASNYGNVDVTTREAISMICNGSWEAPTTRSTRIVMTMPDAVIPASVPVGLTIRRLDSNNGTFRGELQISRLWQPEADTIYSGITVEPQGSTTVHVLFSSSVFEKYGPGEYAIRLCEEGFECIRPHSFVRTVTLATSEVRECELPDALLAGDYDNSKSTSLGEAARATTMIQTRVIEKGIDFFVTDAEANGVLDSADRDIILQNQIGGKHCIRINKGNRLEITYPRGGETLYGGSPTTLMWHGVAKTVQVIPIDSSSSRDLSRPIQYLWKESQGDNMSGSLQWTIPRWLPAGNYILQVTSGSNTATTTSFSIAQNNAPGDSYHIPVIVLNYFPENASTSTAARLRSYADYSAHTMANMISVASAYHGYKDPQAVPSMQYSIVETIERFEPYPRVPDTQNKVPDDYIVDYQTMLNALNICDRVENQGIKEVWVFSGPILPIPGTTNAPESMMSGPFGNISNSSRDVDYLPTCGKSYIAYHFANEMAPNLHDLGHQLESMFYYVDIQIFREFVGDYVYSKSGIQWNKRGCGSTHVPPNGTSEYAYGVTNGASTNCPDWNPDGPVQQTTVNCNTWSPLANCAHGQDSWADGHGSWLIYWMQNMPGKNNQVSIRGHRIRNWWEFLGDFDNAVRARKSMYLLDSNDMVTLSLVGTNGGFDIQNITTEEIQHCSGACTRQYRVGDTVRLRVTATPNSGYRVSSFSVPLGEATCSVGGQFCDITMHDDITLSPSYALNTGVLNVEKSGSGTGRVLSDTASGAIPDHIDCGTSCSMTVNAYLDLYAVPDSGSVFVDWSGCEFAQQNDCVVDTYNQQVTVNARFDLVASSSTTTSSRSTVSRIAGTESDRMAAIQTILKILSRKLDALQAALKK